jgi:hypothetical protein
VWYVRVPRTSRPLRSRTRILTRYVPIFVRDMKGDLVEPDHDLQVWVLFG